MSTLSTVSSVIRNCTGNYTVSFDEAKLGTDYGVIFDGRSFNQKLQEEYSLTEEELVNILKKYYPEKLI